MMEKLRGAISFLKRIDVLYRLMQDRRVSRFKKAKIMGLLSFAFVYFVSPLDLLPEVVLGLGIVDDAVILTFIASVLNGELDKYLQGYGDYKVKKSDGVIEVESYSISDEDDKGRQ